MHFSPNRPIDDLDRAPSGEQESEPNLAPMLDTIFLIMAVVLAVLVRMSPVEGLPIVGGKQGEHADSYELSQRVEVSLAADGLAQVNGEPVRPDQLVAAVNQVEQQMPVKAVYLLANADVPYGEVARTLALLQRPRHPPVFLGITRQ